MDHHDHPADDGEGPVYHAETFVFTGNGGPALLATMQTLMNRMMQGQHQQPAQSEQHEQPEQQVHPEQQVYPEQQVHPEHQMHPEQQAQPEPRNHDADMLAADDPPVPDLPHDIEEDMPSLEPLSNDGAPPASRPIRPLPRPHAHFHAHTPGGIIDLFTFNVGGPPPPPPPPGTATFTFNLGPDVLAGFEAFFLGDMQKDREPDAERAKVLLKGMATVPEGLVRRLERAGGVPGGQGSGDSAGCAVCWGPLLDEVEPGEWDTAKEKDDKAKMAADDRDKPAHGHDDLHGRIVALPCAHVYHAECLLPWFSRNTTCPTCRFDVDPESLTWTPRPPAGEPPPPPPPPPGNNIPQEIPAGVPPPPHGAQAAPNAQADQHQRMNAIHAARFNAFLNTVLRAAPFPHAHPPQPAPEAQPHPQNPAEHPIFGPEPPPAPPPNPFVLPPLFRMPLFGMPPPGQPGAPGGNAPNVPPPASQFPNSPPHPHFHPPAFAFGPANGDHFFDHLHPHPPPPPPPPRRERKKWTPPEPVGRTLRQRVEEKERELGLRCDDVVCGVAPSDDDPTPAALQSESGTKRVRLRAAYDAHGKACEHSFHPACLVTSARVAGVTGDEDGLRDGDAEDVEDGDLQVACPVCRAIGLLTRTEWDEGVQESEAEIA